MASMSVVGPAGSEASDRRAGWALEYSVYSAAASGMSGGMLCRLTPDAVTTEFATADQLGGVDGN